MAVVELNVGGVKFTTTKATLTREPESMLARMFDGDLAPCERDRKGRHVIDRSGKAFEHVLAYLRGDTCKFPASKAERLQLLADADYYQGVLQRSGFYVAQGTPIILMDDWVCKELRQTANILQHDMARMGYIVEIRETGRYESIVQPQGTFSWIIITFDDGKQG